MKALEQNYRKGTLEVVDLPVPRAGAARVVVRTQASLASVGTERSMVELAKKSLVGKALARPDLVRQVIDKVKSDGLFETWRQVMGRLDTPILLGYYSAGVVEEVGTGVSEFTTGDRIAASGSGYAGRIEVASVPSNPCVPIPDGVTTEDAALVAVGGNRARGRTDGEGGTWVPSRRLHDSGIPRPNCRCVGPRPEANGGLPVVPLDD